MSLLEKKNLNYLTTVEQHFLALKESGMALSASDYDLIGQWEARQIPVDVLCRAIDIGFQEIMKHNRAERPGKLSLTRIREQVESALQKAARP